MTWNSYLNITHRFLYSEMTIIFPNRIENLQSLVKSRFHNMTVIEILRDVLNLIIQFKIEFINRYTLAFSENINL